MTTSIPASYENFVKMTKFPFHCVTGPNPTPFDRKSYISISWWRHQMETFSALLAIFAVNSPVPVNSPHKGQWRGALMFSLICVWIKDWVNNREAGDLRRYRAHYDVIVMFLRLQDFTRQYELGKTSVHLVNKGPETDQCTQDILLFKLVNFNNTTISRRSCRDYDKFRVFIEPLWGLRDHPSLKFPNPEKRNTPGPHGRGSVRNKWNQTKQ